MIQLSHSYMTTGKTIALTIQTFVSKVVSLLFNSLSRFVTAFTFKLWYWRRLLRVPWTARSNQSILKEINPEHSLEGLCWRWSSNTLATWYEDPTYWKRLWCWERLRAGGEGITEDEMVGWYHWLNGHEFEQTLGDSEGQGSLACCISWGHKESNTT